MNQNRTYTYGQNSGQGSYQAPGVYQQTGPKVTAGGHDRYDNYGGNGYNYGTPHHKDRGCLEKCLACCGALACCCCICDALT